MTDFNPDLDLLLERSVDVPPHLVWAAWTTPELVTQWFAPRPWTTVRCEIDLRPGGRFHTTMRSPEGEEYPSDGCFLEVVENERLVFTSALGPGFRPAGGEGADDLPFTAVISLAPAGDGTRYSALAMHADIGTCKRHEEMGFHDGWGAALDQLVALVKTL
jgi:uncharacterized protein YndB with AHSA1/START domain